MRNINKRRENLKKALQSAKTNDEMLKVLTEMESCFEEEDLGMEIVTLANKFLTENSLENAISFGKRALSILLKNQKKWNQNNDFDMDRPFIFIDPSTGRPHSCELVPSLIISSVLVMLASASLELVRYDECLSYLNWSVRILSKLDIDKGNSSCGGKCVLRSLVRSQLVLFHVKTDMGRQDEVVFHSRKILEFNERILEEGCLELGNDNESVYRGYLSIMNFKEALPFCLKALEIYVELLGCDSVKVVGVRRDLVFIYKELCEYEKALEQNRLSQGIMEKTTPHHLDLLKAQAENGNLLIELGRYEEAVDVLKGVLSQAPTEGRERAFALVSLATALCEMEKFDDAKQYLKSARRILENVGMDPITVAVAFGSMTKLYEKMDYFETAISLMRRVLAMPELPKEYLANASARLFSLVFLTKKEKELISYLEDMVEKLKEIFGPDHGELGQNYLRLGMACVNLDRKEVAVKYLVYAKNIMDVSFGPNHSVSLRASQMLSITYTWLERHDLALEIQQKIVEDAKGLGPRKQEFKDDAVGLLNQCKEWVVESPARAIVQIKDSSDLRATISKPGISDDGRETK